MTAREVVDELKALGKPSIKKVLIGHGACEPFFGVSIEDLKKLQKRIKKDHALALELYETGISDAMYLAGLIVDDARMTRKDLTRWVKAAYWSLLSESTVPWVAAEGPHGWAMGWSGSNPGPRRSPPPAGQPWGPCSRSNRTTNSTWRRSASCWIGSPRRSTTGRIACAFR